MGDDLPIELEGKQLETAFGDFAGKHNLDRGHLSLLKQCSEQVLAQVVRQDFTSYDVLDRPAAAVEYARQIVRERWDVDGAEMVESFCKRRRLQPDIAARLREELSSETQLKIVLPAKPWAGNELAVRFAIFKRVAQAQSTAASAERFVGKIVATGPKYCILRCKETYARFRKDVFLKFSDNPAVEEMPQDSLVEFSVRFDTEKQMPRARDAIKHAGPIQERVEERHVQAESRRRMLSRTGSRLSGPKSRSRSRDRHRARAAGSTASVAASAYSARPKRECSEGLSSRSSGGSMSGGESAAVRHLSSWSDLPSLSLARFESCSVSCDVKARSARSSSPTSSADVRDGSRLRAGGGVALSTMCRAQCSENSGAVLELRGFEGLAECTASSRGLARTLAETFEPTLSILPDYRPGHGPAIKCSWPTEAGHVRFELQSAALCRGALLVIDGLAVLGKTAKAVVL